MGLNTRIHFVTDTQDVGEQQKSDVAAGLTIDKKQKDAGERFELGRDSAIIDELTRQNKSKSGQYFNNPFKFYHDREGRFCKQRKRPSRNTKRIKTSEYAKKSIKFK